MIQDFLPLELYEAPQRAYQARMTRVMAILWGVPMTLYSLLDAGSLLEMVVGVVVGVPAALLFGFLGTWTMTLGVRKLVRRVYAGDPRIVPAAPAGEYEYRFPCSYLPSPTMAVGGILYLGRAEWTFIPTAGT